MTTGPNAVDEGHGDEGGSSDRGDNDIPARFDSGFEPDENEPFFDSSAVSLQLNIARDLLEKLTVYGGNVTRRAEIVAGFITKLAEQPDPDRLAVAQRLAAMAAGSVQDLPTVVGRLLDQFLSNGAVTPDKAGKAGLNDNADRVRAMVEGLRYEHNIAKAATEQLQDPQSIARAVEKLVPAAKMVEKLINDFIATGFGRLSHAAEYGARVEARFDFARETVHGNQELASLMGIQLLVEWWMRRSRRKALMEKWRNEEADTGGTDSAGERDDDGPTDGDGWPG